MTLLACALLLAAALPIACAPLRPPPDEPFIDLQAADPRIEVDIRYATADNFTKTALYPANRCLLRAAVARRLSRAQTALAKEGLGLKVWDCYRPLAIQRKLWALVPDPRYVADPAKGSRHNRGAAVDLTLVDAAGRELEMPTAYDDFSERAHRDYATPSAAAARNRRFLETALAKQGFEGLPTEWWHFDAPGWRRYPIADVPLAPAP
ncbi:MAG: D-alanyl-D-alanine dipeptidase [Elusimicrobia bacterium]|nr:D-alanyl-D-alanine dipeptidase [Elusimicrobiota bacterium]